MTSPCAKHPVLRPVVGVCASCLEEKLATCVSNFKANGGEQEQEQEEQEGGGGGDELCESSMIGNEGNLNSSPRRPFSYYLEDKVYSNYKDSSSHKKSSSCDGVYEESSLYGSHYYASNEGRCLRGGGGAKENPLYEKARPRSRPSQRRGGAKESPLCEKEKPPSSWLSAFFSKRGGQHKAKPSEGSIAPWRVCESGKYEVASPRSTTWDPPRPSSWEQLSSWEKPSSSPLKLASLLRSHSPSSPLNLPLHTISPSPPSSTLRLPPLLTSQSSTRFPLKLPPSLGSQSTKSSSRPPPPLSCQPPVFPLKLPPLLGSQSTKSSSRPPPPLSCQPPVSPLKLPSPLGSQPTIASDPGTQIGTVSLQIETNQRSGHSCSAAQPQKKSVWFRVFLRNRWTVRFKRRFAKKERQEEEADSARTSSVTESDNYRHSQNHCVKEKHYFQNQQISIVNRPTRGGSVNGRDYGAWGSYYSPVHNHSFHGGQARHRYNSVSCVQRGESTELLRLYLTPVRGPSLRSKIRSF